MLKKISTVYPLGSSKLLLWFQGGEARVFDCAAHLPARDLRKISGAKTFSQVAVSAEGYAVSWGADVDLTSKELFEESEPADVSEAEKARVLADVTRARKQRGISQVQLEEMAGVRQPVIARMETGATAPRLDTLIKVLAPLGKTLAVVDLTAS